MTKVKKLLEIGNALKELDYADLKLGLMGGKSGIVLFLAYYGMLAKDEKALDISLEIIESSIDNINNGYSYPSYADGVAGFGWLIEHLVKNNILDSDVSDILNPIDTYLIDWQCEMLEDNKYDYLHNGLGATLYFSTKKKVPKNKLMIVPELLRKKSVLGDNGQLKWLSDFENGNDSLKCNLGLSHGNPSIISILCKLYNAGINQSLCNEMIKLNIEFLINSKLPKDSISIFPHSIPLDKGKNDSRLAWCYGDLGVGLSLYQAGKTLQDKGIIQEAIDTFTHSAKRRDLKLNGVNDAGLCHGSAGIAQIFYRMYWETGIELFNETHNYWLQKTLDFAIHKDGIVGYKTHRSDGDITSLGFLEGVAGIGLAFLSSIYKIDPVWDECLLMS